MPLASVNGTALRCPVTLLIGDSGEALFQRTSHRLERALPDPRIIRIENSAHLIAVDRPRALAEVVREAAREHGTGREKRHLSPQEARE